MKKVYGYIRVSTVKQGTGVSLQEQKEAIVRYAEKHQLNIIEWFEEQETAAKQGRPLFTKMLRLLRKGNGQGVIIHKIDRSARNLKDWATLGDLIDEGIEVHFAHESLDMDTRGGRLAADIQAVIASDYIRNLRDETLKGLYGRLKQGFYPFGAPIGYVDNGRGQYKTIDPVKGPLIRKAFQLYGTSKYGLLELAEKMKALGLSNTKGSYVSVTTLSKILNNPFYCGVLRVSGKTFQGGHEPLISSGLYAKVQEILNGKTSAKIIKNDFIFRRLLKCHKCNYSLIGESQKGYVYYRCHSRTCKATTVREDRLESTIVDTLGKIQLHPCESNTLNDLLKSAETNWSVMEKKLEEGLKIQIRSLGLKLERLTDAFVDNIIDKDLFQNKKEKMLAEMQGLKAKESQISIKRKEVFTKTKLFLEFLNDFKNSYIKSLLEEKRKILKTITSNLVIQDKNLLISMKSPFQEIANRYELLTSDLVRNRPRTCTVKNATLAISGDNQDYKPLHVADLSIDPVTGQADFSNSVPIVPQEEDMEKMRENMQQLLDLIISFFQEEQAKVDSGELQADEVLLPDVQTNDPNTQYSPRPIPENFKRKRA